VKSVRREERLTLQVKILPPLKLKHEGGIMSATIRSHKRDAGKQGKKRCICRYCRKPIDGPNRFFHPKCQEIVDREPWDDETYSGYSAHGHLRAMGAY